MKLRSCILAGFIGLSSLALSAMDGEYQMPSKTVIYERLTSGATCFDEHDTEADNLATILAGKQLPLHEIESRVNGAVNRHCNYLAQVLADMEPATSLERSKSGWKKRVLIAVLQDYADLVKDIENK